MKSPFRIINDEASWTTVELWSQTEVVKAAFHSMISTDNHKVELCAPQLPMSPGHVITYRIQE